MASLALYDEQTEIALKNYREISAEIEQYSASSTYTEVQRKIASLTLADNDCFKAIINSVHIGELKEAATIAKKKFWEKSHKYLIDKHDVQEK